MAKEVLYIPEENLQEVINIIRAGLEAKGLDISDDTRSNLIDWCEGEEEYLKELSKED